MVDVMSTWDKHEDDLRTLAGITVFVQQLTGKDVAYAQSQGLWKTYNTQMQVELILNSVSGRITGWNPFPNVSSYPQTFNLSNALNRWTYLGAGIYLLAEFGVIPSKYKKWGSTIAIAGAAGGVFDDPQVAPGPGNQAPPQGNNINASRAPGATQTYANVAPLPGAATDPYWGKHLSPSGFE